MSDTYTPSDITVVDMILHFMYTREIFTLDELQGAKNAKAVPSSLLISREDGRSYTVTMGPKCNGADLDRHELGVFDASAVGSMGWSIVFDFEKFLSTEAAGELC
jgi:hypothetical protein